MKTVLFLGLLLLVSSALAREEPIPDSTSPDKRFYVAVEEVDSRL